MAGLKQIIILLAVLACFPVGAQTERQSWDTTKKNTPQLKALLNSPLDLQAYKKLKPGRSNSGGGGRYDYFYKPPYKGFPYFYFVFPGYNEHGPRITTYKKGSEIGGYMDSSEVFIQLSSDRTDKDLGKADLLSFTDKELLKKFGDNYLREGDIIVYQHNKTLLILSFSSHRWFKIVKLNKSFRNFDELKEAKNLLSYL